MKHFVNLIALALFCLIVSPVRAQFTQQQKLFGSGAVGSYVYQGWSVSLSSDGNTAIVGRTADNSNAGAASGVYAKRWCVDTAAKTFWLRASGERISRRFSRPFGRW